MAAGSELIIELNNVRLINGILLQKGGRGGILIVEGGSCTLIVTSTGVNGHPEFVPPAHKSVMVFRLTFEGLVIRVPPAFGSPSYQLIVAVG